MENRNQRLGANHSTLWAVIFLAGIVGWFTALLSGFYVPAYAGKDPHGYLMTAKGLATRGDAAKHLSDPFEYVSNNMYETRDDVYYSTYGIGYPRLCAVVYRLWGPSAVFLVNPILAALAVIGIFLLGRAMLGDLAGAFAAILLATNPVFAVFGLSGHSHAASICFAVWGMFFLWRWADKGGWGNALLGGALAGYAATVRYTEALLALPILVLVVSRCARVWKDRAARENGSTRSQTVGQLAAMGLAAALAITHLLVHQWIAYGSPLANGYALSGESTSMSWQWLVRHWWQALDQMNADGLYLIFPLSLAGLAFLASRDTKKMLFLALWAIPGYLVYVGYWWISTGPQWLRYFVSIYPALILSAVAMLGYAVRERSPRILALGLFVLLVSAANVRQTFSLLDQQMSRQLFSQTTAAMVRANVPPHSVILSDNQVVTYLDYDGEYRLYADQMFNRDWIASVVRLTYTDDPSAIPRRRARKIERLLGDRDDDQIAGVLRDLVARHLAAGRDVALVSPDSAIGRWRGRLGDRFDWVAIARWDAPNAGGATGSGSPTWSLYSLKLRGESPPAIH